MELRHLQRAFDHAHSRADAVAVLRRHGGKSTPDSVPHGSIEACTHEMRALNSGSATPKVFADLDPLAIMAKFNATPTGRTTG